MAISPDLAHHRARLANAVRRGDDGAAEDASRNLRAARLEEHVTKALASAPPLSDEQRWRIARLLLGGTS